MVNIVETDQLRWIVLLPLLAAVYHGVMIGVVRRPTPRWLIIALSCGSVGLSFVLSLYHFAELIALPEGHNVLLDDVYTWIGAGLGAENLTVEFALAFDALSALMCLIVTGVGLLIHLYSVGYMEDDEREDRGFQRFFCYMNLFTFSMLVLVLGDGLVLMFLGWEGVGVCSYLLIGFWYMDRWNAACGAKAFVVNRIGDFGFLVGFLVLFAALADAGVPAAAFREIAVDFGQIADILLTLPVIGEVRLASVVASCFLLGAVGKSAQLPLSVWLPDAMAGPTPVSALIHAATMVTAGIYMVCRLSFVYVTAPEVSLWMAWIGAVTAFFAASVAIAQDDIKKVLAYSTVSQLGYMFLAAGCGGYSAALFHLTTHAFFKALLFLAAGSVILALHHEQDIEKMGGLRRLLPLTHAVFLVGVLAIAGVPPFSGFFSKDAILASVYASELPGHEWLYRIALGSVVLTAFYMWRLHCRVFFGRTRVAPALVARVEEPSSWLTNPLVMLAVLAFLAGWAGLGQAWGDLLGVPGESNSLAHFLRPVLDGELALELEHAVEYRLAGSALLASLAGIGLAHLLYVRFPKAAEISRQGLAIPRRLLEKGYYVDALYQLVIVRPLIGFAERVLYRFVDVRLVDGVAVEGGARLVRALAGRGIKFAHSGFTQSYVFWMVIGALCVVAALVD